MRFAVLSGGAAQQTCVLKAFQIYDFQSFAPFKELSTSWFFKKLLAPRCFPELWKPN